MSKILFLQALVGILAFTSMIQVSEAGPGEIVYTCRHDEKDIYGKPYSGNTKRLVLVYAKNAYGNMVKKEIRVSVKTSAGQTKTMTLANIPVPKADRRGTIDQFCDIDNNTEGGVHWYNSNNSTNGPYFYSLCIPFNELYSTQFDIIDQGESTNWNCKRGSK